MAVSLRHALARALVVCGIVAVCPVSATLTPSGTLKASPTCAELTTWAYGYRDVSIDLQMFARLDGARRRAVFAAVKPAVRAALWHEQLQILEAQPRWSDAQRSLFRQGRSVLTADVYDQQTEALRRLAAFKKRVESEFVSQQDRRVWSDLGSVVPSINASLVPYCDCNFASQDCWGGRVCGGGPCQRASPGCGFAGASVCDGLCI